MKRWTLLILLYLLFWTEVQAKAIDLSVSGVLKRSMKIGRQNMTKQILRMNLKMSQKSDFIEPFKEILSLYKEEAGVSIKSMNKYQFIFNYLVKFCVEKKDENQNFFNSCSTNLFETYKRTASGPQTFFFWAQYPSIYMTEVNYSAYIIGGSMVVKNYEKKLLGDCQRYLKTSPLRTDEGLIARHFCYKALSPNKEIYKDKTLSVAINYIRFVEKKNLQLVSTTKSFIEHLFNAFYYYQKKDSPKMIAEFTRAKSKVAEKSNGNQLLIDVSKCLISPTPKNKLDVVNRMKRIKFAAGDGLLNLANICLGHKKNVNFLKVTLLDAIFNLAGRK